MSSTEKSTSKFPWPIPNGNVGEYQLHCHCGAIRYTMKLSPPLYASETTLAAPERYEAVECDCSQCERHGIWAAHPFIKDVHFAEGVSGEQWERGSELRKEYRCGGKVNPHYFCPECGSVLATDLTALMKNVMKVKLFTGNAQVGDMS